MASFVSKPVRIDAIRYTGKNFASVVRWARKLNALDCNSLVHVKSGIEIVTLEGVMIASPGDWIICGTIRELYPCKAEVFERKYYYDSPVMHCYVCKQTKPMAYQQPGNTKTGEPILRWSMIEVEGKGHRCKTPCKP